MVWSSSYFERQAEHKQPDPSKVDHPRRGGGCPLPLSATPPPRARRAPRRRPRARPRPRARRPSRPQAPSLPRADRLAQRSQLFPRLPAMAPSRTKKESASPTPPSDDPAPKDPSETAKIKRKSVSPPPTFPRPFHLSPPPPPHVLSSPPPARHHFFLSPAPFPLLGRPLHVHAFLSLCRQQS